MILLTAIEHAREETMATEEQPACSAMNSNISSNSEEPKDKIIVLETGEEAWVEKTSYIKVGSRRWICVLQALGKSMLQFTSKLQNYFSEAKVLPTCVLLLAMVYIIYAASLYLPEH